MDCPSGKKPIGGGGSVTSASLVQNKVAIVESIPLVHSWNFALTLVMAVPAQPASAAETTTFEFTEAVFNTCNNDLTVINGKERITTEVMPLSGGRFRYFFHDVKRGTGSGLTGKQYTYRNTFTDSFVATPAGGLVASTVRQTITLKKVGGPRSENMDVDVFEKITFDAKTGEALRVQREFEAECE